MRWSHVFALQPDLSFLSRMLAEEFLMMPEKSFRSPLFDLVMLYLQELSLSFLVAESASLVKALRQLWG